MQENYSYPLDPSWSTAEIETVVAMFNVVEDAYEVGAAPAKVKSAYQAFKEVVPAKGEEKRLGREFEQVSGYSLYRVVQAAKENPKKVKLTRGK